MTERRDGSRQQLRELVDLWITQHGYRPPAYAIQWLAYKIIKHIWRKEDE